MRGKIGELAVANDFLEDALKPLDRQVRRGMIERAHQTLSIRSQWRLLSISRSSFYYEPRGETEMNLDLMRLIRCPLLGHFKCPVRQRAGECEAIAERGQAIFGDAARRCSPSSRTSCE
ncbi:MAG: hypothetical protein ACJAVR_002996 [Paracoccaceae bacterium]|jgi:hypothetical protein